MIEERKTGPFRGVNKMIKLLWWWDLLWVGLCVWMYAAGSGFHGVMAVIFLVLWVMAEMMRVTGNRRYDEETRLLKTLTKAETRLW